MSISTIERKNHSTNSLLLQNTSEKEEALSAHLSNENSTDRNGDIIYTSSTTSTEQVDIVEKALKTAFEGMTQPAYAGLQYINRIDPKTRRLLRYEIPPVSLFDYMYTGPVSGLYASTEAGLFHYDESVGCFAALCLIKKLEDSEDCYEELVNEYQCERHALQTDIKRDWARSLYRKTNYEAYKQEGQETRRRQLTGMQKIVEFWDKTNHFLKVYIPSPEERIEKLNHYPELVACTDLIFLVYKPHPPEERYSTGIPMANQVHPPMAELQKRARASHDYRNRSYLTKTFDYLASLVPESEAQYRAVRHAHNDYSCEISEPKPYRRVTNAIPPDQNSSTASSSGQGDQGSFFFQCWGALVSFFRMIFRCIFGDNQQEE